MRRSLGLVLAIGMLATACGGEADEAADGQSAEDASASTQADAADDAASNETTTTAPAVEGDAADDGGGGSGPSTATVTIGDETYSFTSEGAVVAQCLTDLFGIFSVQLPMADGGDGSVAIIALREGTDPAEVGEVNSISVAVGDDDWIADEDDSLFEQDNALEPGMGQVDSVEIDGRTVRGTATFFRQNSVFTGEVETLTGTFEATCGEERTS